MILHAEGSSLLSSSLLIVEAGAGSGLQQWHLVKLLKRIGLTKESWKDSLQASFWNTLTKNPL
jgi:hypothetical protein